jgi:hypothetical protein
VGPAEFCFLGFVFKRDFADAEYILCILTSSSIVSTLTGISFSVGAFLTPLATKAAVVLDATEGR